MKSSDAWICMCGKISKKFYNEIISSAITSWEISCNIIFKSMETDYYSFTKPCMVTFFIGIYWIQKLIWAAHMIRFTTPFQLTNEAYIKLAKAKPEGKW